MHHPDLPSSTAVATQQIHTQPFKFVPEVLLVAGTLVLQTPLQFLCLMEAALIAVAAYQDCRAGIPTYHRTLLWGVGKEQIQSLAAI